MRKLFHALTASILGAGISLNALGDDIEIYLGAGSDTLTYNPNVLFIMDTSGSMAGKDGTDESRMLRVQNALKEALRSATNINAGLMRFSDYGGPILYPVKPIDAPVDPEIITSISSGADDAFEQNGSMNVSSDRIKLVEGTSSITAGFRFADLNIPRGAVITSARIRFTSDGYNITQSNLTFKNIASGDVAPFSNSTRLTSLATGAESVEWSEDNDWPTGSLQVRSIDISNVVQEVIDRPDWCGGNSLGLLVEGQSGSSAAARYIRSYEDGNSESAELVVTYDQASATGCISGEQYYQVSAQRNNAEEQSNGYYNTGSELTLNASSNQYVGIRFENVSIPKDAVIDEAYLIFGAYQNRSGSASMRIRMVNEASPGRFRNNDRYRLRDAPKTSGVVWSGIPAWYKNRFYWSPDIASELQQIVNRGDWQSGNDAMFVLSDFSGNRGAYTYNGKPSRAPYLYVKFQGNAIPETVATVRDHLLNKVDELAANGYTPIVDTLYEAASYYGGRDVYWGRTRGNNNVSENVRRYTRVSHRDSYVGLEPVRPNGCSEDNLNDSDCIGEYIPTGAKYISPVTDLQCQTNNHIVLLSDGEANNNHSVNEIEALLGQRCVYGSGGEKCGLDLIRNISKSSESVIGPRIITHTIGFAANSTANNFLNQLALQGGGNFYTASDSGELVTAFESILRSVKDVNATFVSPGVAVNQLNRLTHRDELYFALFKPSEGTDWPGNLKKYKITGNTIVDKNGVAAVDDGTGYFKETSHSYWSVLADGADVRAGGAAHQLGTTRNVYTFSGTGNIATTSNRLAESNSGITVADLGIADQPNPSDLRNVLLKWARGIDVQDADDDGSTTDARMQMGDPIHSQPVIVNYSDTDSAILVATNQGYLHSFDPDTGNEHFAIIPKELLSNLHDFYKNNSSFTHIYGLDGDMVLRDTGTKLMLYVGMRRGGRNIYAFDITNKTAPSLSFKIEGGTGDFAKLGQTWSKPVITKVNIGGSVKEVMIFAGGYDVNQDNKLIRSADTMGNAVFMVDADSGALLWSASDLDANLNIAEMKYSIPARVAVIDRDDDGLADHMYVADTGAQLFRLDIYNGKGVNELVKGQRLADFGGDDDPAENRRFFYAPDVSEISMGTEHYYAVAMGTGYRAHPLNTQIKDNIYMLKDEGVFEVDENGHFSFPTQAYTALNLYDATDHNLTSADGTTRQLEAAAMASKQGWMIRLGNGGEKVLASPLILNYKVFVTTYLPASISESACAPPSGNSRAYLLELVNANAVTDLNNDSDLSHQDRYVDLQQTGIAPETKILIEDALHPVVCLGTECGSAVIEQDEDGNEMACTTQLDCLAQNILGRLKRVQKSTWKTETERQ